MSAVVTLTEPFGGPRSGKGNARPLLYRTPRIGRHPPTKKNKSQVLDQLVEVTGWNRDQARRQLRRRVRQPNGRAQATVAVLDRRRTKGKKYPYDAIKVLQHVWAVAGGICGKYLAASMVDWLDAMEAVALTA